MASESSGADFGARAYKFYANVIEVVVISFALWKIKELRIF
jgi:hypothetical protein